MARKRTGAPDTPNKGGRPPIVINWPMVDVLLAVQASLSDVAEELRVSEDTIERACERERGMGFADYADKKRGRGRNSIRKKQLSVALAGNVTMLIWLGKQWLGQADKSEVTGKDGGPIQQQDVPATDRERADAAAALIRRAEMRKAGAQ